MRRLKEGSAIIEPGAYYGAGSMVWQPTSHVLLFLTSRPKLRVRK